MTMSLRSRLHRYVPAQFDDPFGLAWRLIRSGDAAAWFAMAAAAGGAACAPLDALLLPLERQLNDVAPADSQRPLILVCGAPRSGTTVVYQTLVSHLPVGYFSNLTALFPRSPLAAQRMFGRFLQRPSAAYHSFYGRTHGLAGTNDALFLWDRWLGADRATAPADIDDESRHAMRAFFDACASVFAQPLVNKNNSLNLSAHMVAEALPQARFICLTRDRRQLARSLYRARCDIHGTPTESYGAAQESVDGKDDDPVRAVCNQAAYYDAVNDLQRLRLGDERFWLVSYEEFCQDPGALVRRVAREALGDEELVVGTPPASFAVSRGERVASDVAARIDAELSLAACG